MNPHDTLFADLRGLMRGGYALDWHAGSCARFGGYAM